MSNLRLRVISAVILGAVVVALAAAGGMPFRVLAIVVGAAILYEWCEITGVLHDRLRATMLVAGYAALALAIMAGRAVFPLWTVFLAALFAALVADLVRRGAFWGVGGLCYAGLSAIALAGLRDSGAGLVTLFFLFGVVWATDIFAYFTGRALGGPKLAPRISPNKTWSGAVGGAVSAVIAGVAVAAVSGRPFGVAVPLVAMVLSAASQIGDLFESWIKRRFGRKDASHLIPGHGGVMDRVDGLVIAAMALYFTITVWNQPGFLAGGTGAP